MKYSNQYFDASFFDLTNSIILSARQVSPSNAEDPNKNTIKMLKNKSMLFGTPTEIQGVVTIVT